MPARPLTVAVAVAAAAAPLALSTPASAHETAPQRSGSSTSTAAGPQVIARASVISSARTAYSGRYAKFLASFRCSPGRVYQLDGLLEQPSRDAIATSMDEGPTGVCTGSTQRRMVYLVIQRPEGHSAPVRLVTGRGQATVLLSTAARGSSRPRLHAAALATVRVHPR